MNRWDGKVALYAAAAAKGHQTNEARALAHKQEENARREQRQRDQEAQQREENEIQQVITYLQEFFASSTWEAARKMLAEHGRGIKIAEKESATTSRSYSLGTEGFRTSVLARYSDWDAIEEPSVEEVVRVAFSEEKKDVLGLILAGLDAVAERLQQT